MTAAALITFREGLEAALIIGIVIAVLRQMGRRELEWSVWLGVSMAVALSLVAALGLYAAGAQLEGRAEEVFEGSAMLLAAAFLTWMILWMQQHGSQLRSRLSADAQAAASAGQRRGVVLIAFLAVAREGFETVLLLAAVSAANALLPAVVGGAIGLLLAIAVGWLVFTATVRLDLRQFFVVTGGLLIVVAAGLVAHGVHELQEASVLPIVVEHVWDTNGLLNEDSGVGVVAKATVGYNGNPSLLEVVSCFAFYVAIGAVLVWRRNRAAPNARSQPKVVD